MEPRIQYAQTKDGVSIAYYTVGEGTPPLVHMPTIPMSHLEVEWQNPAYRRWYEGLARARQLVRYDGRGTGLSDRELSGYSAEGHILDLEAVVDRLAVEKFALLAFLHAGPIAVDYAARHPDRVSHLLLWCTYARGSDYSGLPEVQTLRQLIGVNWETYTEATADVTLGRPRGDEGRWMAAYMRDSVRPEAARAALGVTNEVDVSALLPEVKMPTLVLHRRQFRLGGIGLARELASKIPDARLVVLEGASVAPYMDDTERAVTAIDEFLGEGEEADTKAELPEGMAVILFADIVESAALTEKLGDAAFRAKARELDTSLRAIIRECSGTPVEGKLVGDGVLAVFTSARQAIDCALRCEAAGQPLGLQLHLGIHAGDVIREGNNVYGGAVNIAARIAAASPPGEVLVSDTVRGLARTSAGVAFDDRGEHVLKGVADPQRLFAVRGGSA